MSQNDYQVGGSHYKRPGKIEHWDFVWMHSLDYFQAAITKYVMRHRDKGGIQDLKKAQHFLAKYIELLEGDKTPVLDAIPSQADPVRTYKAPPEPYVPSAPVSAIKPTGWVKYSFEGMDSQGALYTCRDCRIEVRCPPEEFPGRFHVCSGNPAAPTGAYVNQG